ncbi:hypothetical protein M3201_21500 [Paenibacillus motobuensis]|uniref:HYD1 signature containing ADP-ribosyltransferase family protein n=1 Tax=Paenibacillus TaxID=44249 RepID=UPI00203A67FA|nr:MULTISPECIES: HYD1 signature containing ADP-ribosyltransferase family protein [Paenibacillus]MCM3042237.1 hypothetical protein [Paenibacillus lutimineralis]MCM3649341.1 hypothetical protein [Paenibacillus motobuensis]
MALDDVMESAAPKEAPKVKVPVKAPTAPDLKVINGGKNSNNSKPKQVPPPITDSKPRNKENEKKRLILYHYTDEKGYNGILSSKVIFPSLKAINPRDAWYADGQYFTDIVPNTMSRDDLSYVFYRNTRQAYRLKYYVAVDVSGLPLKKGRDGVYVTPNKNPLFIGDRLVSHGRQY